MEAPGNSENKAHPNWRTPQQELPMTIRGGGNPKLHMVLRTADVEWARRPGGFATDAHAASWFGSTGTDRIQVCRATLRAWLGELASDICRRLLTPAGNGGSPDPAKPAAVLVTVKDKSLRDGAGWPAMIVKLAPGSFPHLLVRPLATISSSRPGFRAGRRAQ